VYRLKLKTLAFGEDGVPGGTSWFRRSEGKRTIRNAQHSKWEKSHPYLGRFEGGPRRSSRKAQRCLKQTKGEYRPGNRRKKEEVGKYKKLSTGGIWAVTRGWHGEIDWVQPSRPSNPKVSYLRGEKANRTVDVIRKDMY